MLRFCLKIDSPNIPPNIGARDEKNAVGKFAQRFNLGVPHHSDNDLFFVEFQLHETIPADELMGCMAVSFRKGHESSGICEMIQAGLWSDFVGPTMTSMKYPESIHLAGSALVVPSMFIWHLFRPGYKVDMIPLAESVSRKKMYTQNIKTSTPPKMNDWNLKITQLKGQIIFQTFVFGFKSFIFQGVSRNKHPSTKTLRAGRDTTSTTRNQHSGSTQWVFTLRGSMVDTSDLVKH